MTKELLLARRQDLERDIAAQRDAQARGASEIQRLQQNVARARDQENAIGGAIQDVNYWLGILDGALAPLPAPARKLEVAKT